MSDQFTETTYTSPLGRLGSSLGGALIGLALFIAAFPVLWFNEGRVDRGKIAQKSVAIQADQVSASGQLVAASGTLASDEQLGDGGYLKPGPFLTLNRNAEMYAWKENKRTSESRDSRGHTTKHTTYSYERVWTSKPANSRSFNRTEGHENPAMSITSQSSRVSAAALGAYQLDIGSLELPPAKGVNITKQLLGSDDAWTLESGFLVKRRGAISGPQIGDLRISYSAVPNNLDVTLFAKADGGRLTGWAEQGVTLYRAFTSGRDEAIATMHHEYQMQLWMMRLVGFGLLWAGLMLAVSPLTAVLNLVPLLGRIGGFVVGLVVFAVALALAVITITISAIAHNIFLLVALLALVIGSAIMLARWRRDRLAATMS